MTALPARVVALRHRGDPPWRIALALAVGVCINLPWCMPLVYAGALWLGGALVGADAGWALALLVGSAVVGGAAAGVTWVIAVGVMTRRARRRAPAREPETA